MDTKFIEATTSLNYGKFMVGRMTDEEWKRPSAVDRGLPLIRLLGWGPEHLWVCDLQTGEGAWFAVRPNGYARHDLNSKHRIWVCPLFEPFLEWLYHQDVSDLNALPDVVVLDDAHSSWGGYRREGTDVRAV